MIPIHYNYTKEAELRAFCDGLQNSVSQWVTNGYIGDMRSPVIIQTANAQNFMRDISRPGEIWRIFNLCPDDLLLMISDMEQKYPELVTDRNNKERNARAIVSNLYECIEKVFSNYGYDSSNFPDSALVEDLNLCACPYCNRNFVKNIVVKQNAQSRDISVRGQLDHFYPRSLYPYLAISRHNLIPCCPSCNGATGKHYSDTRRLGVVNPYSLRDSKGLVFNMKITGSEFANIDKCSEGISISVDTSSDTRLSANEKIFHLEKIYNSHRDYAAEIYYKYKLKQNGVYLDATKQILRKHKMGLTQDDIYRLQLGAYVNESDYSKRPLSKFIADLARKHGLIPI